MFNISVLKMPLLENERKPRAKYKLFEIRSLIFLNWILNISEFESYLCGWIW